jgi:hypothetical protein
MPVIGEGNPDAEVAFRRDWSTLKSARRRVEHLLHIIGG